MDSAADERLCNTYRRFGVGLLCLAVSTGIAAGVVLTVACVRFGYTGPFETSEVDLLFLHALTPSLGFTGMGTVFLVSAARMRRNGGDYLRRSPEVTREILGNLTVDERAQLRKAIGKDLCLHTLLWVPALFTQYVIVLLPILPTSPTTTLRGSLAAALVILAFSPYQAYRSAKHRRQWLSETSYARAHRIGPQDIP